METTPMTAPPSPMTSDGMADTGIPSTSSSIDRLAVRSDRCPSSVPVMGMPLCKAVSRSVRVKAPMRPFCWSETGTMSTFFEYIREIAVLIVSLMDNCSTGMTILDTFMTEPQSLSGLNKSTSLIRVCFLREQSIKISVLYVKKI